MQKVKVKTLWCCPIERNEYNALVQVFYKPHTWSHFRHSEHQCTYLKWMLKGIKNEKAEANTAVTLLDVREVLGNRYMELYSSN